MFTRILSVFLALIMGVFQVFGITVKPIDLEPTMEIIGEYTCADEDPEIEVSVSKTSFRLILQNDSITFGGAFRNLKVESLKRKNLHTLLIETSGKADDGYSAGYVIVSGKALRAKTDLQAETEIDMSLKDPGINGGGISEDIENLAKKKAKSYIMKGINKIPYVGGIASQLLDSKINDILGIKSPPSIKDVLAKLDEISAQLNDISFEIEKTSQEILKKLYKEENFGYVNQQSTILRNDVAGIYDMIYDIEDMDFTNTNPELDEDLLFEYIRSVKMASLLEFDGQNESQMVKNTKALSSYISGDQVSVSYEDNIFTKAFKYACQNSVLGGEASMVVGPYVNEISNIFANSYKAMTIVLTAKLYVCKNYSAITDMAEKSPALKNALNLLPRKDNYDIDNNQTYFNYLNRLVSEDDKDKTVSLVRKHNELFSDEDENSVTKKYNQMVDSRWFSFVKSAPVSADGIEITFVDLNQNIGSVTPTELGVDTSKHDEGTRTMVEKVNNNLKSKIFNQLSSDEIRKLVEHILDNGNRIFVEKEETDGNHITRNLQKIFEDYGFIFPKTAKGKQIFTSDSQKSYSDKLVGMGVASRDYNASLTATGYNCGNDVEYLSTLTRTGEIKWEDTKYYKHYSNITNGTLCSNTTTTEDCTFYYFLPAPVELRTSGEFADFITSIAEGKTYENETIVLGTDVDLSKDRYEKIWAESKYESNFKGTFNGNFHTIYNLSDSTTYPGSGMFRTLGDGASVANLNLEGINLESKGNKSGCGAVAGRVTGNVTISNVKVKGTVTGYDKVGGLVGEVSNGSLVVKDCENYAEINATGKYAGGIVGGSTSKKSQNISLCINHADVTADNSTGTGGIVGYLADDSADQPHTVTFCTNYGKISSNGGNTGGIIGHLDSDSVDHEVSRNKNENSVTSANGNAGGIVGYSEGGGYFSENSNTGDITGKTAGGILGSNEDDSITFNYSLNSGIIKANANAGGIAGYLGDNDKDKNYYADGCTNSGAVTSDIANAGGIVGHLDTDNREHSFAKCRNEGNISAPSGSAGGVVGYSEGGGYFGQSSNRGDITGKTAGGIIGENEDDQLQFSASSNSGNITAVLYAGGILGYTGSRSQDESFYFSGCYNYGYIVSTTSYAGGIAGVISSDSTGHIFSKCTNGEKVSGHFSTGGIVGKLEGGGTFKGCINYSAITSEATCAGGMVGYVVDDRCTFDDCKNAGAITGVESCGGIVGEAGSKDEDDPFTFRNCYNGGIVTSLNMNAGGMIGMLKTDNKNHVFDGCKNKSDEINGKTSSGGMIGFMYGGGDIKNCINTAKITASDAYAGGMIGRIEDDKCTFTNNTSDGIVSAPKYCGKTCGYDGRTKTTY